MSVPPEIDNAMYDILTRVWERLGPAPADPLRSPVKRHVWRNEKYVGVANGQVQAWYGWSANFKKWGYRTLYIDYVVNTLAPDKRYQLFGDVFSRDIDELSEFVFMFVASVSSEIKDKVIENGFTYRKLDKRLHPGYIIRTDLHIAKSTDYWSNKGLALMSFQKAHL